MNPPTSSVSQFAVRRIPVSQEGRVPDDASQTAVSQSVACRESVSQMPSFERRMGNSQTGAGPSPEDYAYGGWLPSRPCGTSPAALRVVHVGHDLARAGIGIWLRSLERFARPDRLVLTQCVVTSDYVDAELAAEFAAPVVIGGAEAVRRAARDCDVLLFSGPCELGAWLGDLRPRLTVFVAHGEGAWTRTILETNAAVVDHVVAVSERARQLACEGFATTVIPNGIDAAHVAVSRTRNETRAALGLRPEDFVLGYVGRFSPEKRAHAVIEAVARLPGCKALLVGWGSQRDELLRLANDLIPGRFALTEACNYLGDYYMAMDALCLPSIVEGYGLVVPEAMLCGCPVIARNVGCVPELIEDRVNGLVVEGEPESFAAAAALLRDRPDWARGLAAEARTTALERALARRMAARYEEVLAQLLAAKEAAASA